MKFTSAKLVKFMLVVALVIPTLLVLPPQADAYSLLATISSTDLAEPGGVVPSLSRPLGVVVNPANGHVFVANNDCQSFCTISVFADNGAATSASSAYLMSNTVAPRDLAFNISTNHLWVTTDANTVLVLSDGVSGLDGVSQFSLSGFKPNGIAINPATGHVFVTSTDTDGHSAIWVFVDGATPAAFDDPIVRDNESLQGVAVNPSTGHVFATDFQNASVDVLADSSSAVTDYTTVSTQGVDSIAVAVNPNTGHAFVVNNGSNDLTPLLDDSTGIQTGTHIDVGTSPIAIAFNANTSHFYIANSGTLAGSGASLMVLNDNPNFPIGLLDPTISFSSSPSRVAVNTANNRVLVTFGTASQLAVLGDLIPTSVTGTNNTATQADTTVTLTANAWIGPASDNVPVSVGSVHFTVMDSDGTTQLGTDVFGIVNHNGTVSAVYTIPAGTDPGTYTVNLRYFSSDGTYAISDGTGTLEILSDDTPPAASPALSGTLGDNGWYVDTVTVTWNWADNDGGSGIDTANCPATSTYSGPDDSAITLDGTCKDLAGNIGQATSPSFNYDASAPSAAPTINGTEGDNGWYTTPVTIDWNWSDPAGGSGLNSALCPATSSTGSTEGEQPFSVTCSDLAGNSGNASLTVKVDTVPPAINGALTPDSPAASGWYNQSTGAPTLSFTCSDATSGLAEPCPNAYTFPEGADQSYSASVTDNAGLSNSAGVSGINVDLTAPTVSFSGNTGTYSVDQQVNIQCQTADSGSGIASSSCADITGPAYSFGVGSHTYSATAVDVAGNRATASTSFSVTVTPAGICGLETQFIEGSSAFQRQSPTRQASSLRGVQSSCQSAVTSLSRGSGPLQRRTLATYQANLFMYVAQGWLTPAQMQTLVSLVNEL